MTNHRRRRRRADPHPGYPRIITKLRAVAPIKTDDYLLKWMVGVLSGALFIMGVLAVWLMLRIGTLIASGEP